MSLFHPFDLFIDWSGTCVSLVLVWLLGVVCLVFWFACLTFLAFHMDRGV